MNDDAPEQAILKAVQRGEAEGWTFEEAFAYTDDNHERIRLRIKELRGYPEIKKSLTSKKLAAVCHVKTHIIDSFMREDSISLGEESHHDLVRFLWDNRWGTDQWKIEGPARDPGVLFHALTHFLQIHEQSIAELAEEAGGTYVLWAPSLHIPGKFIKGKLVITADEETGAVTTLETHIYTGYDGTAPLKEEFCGFIVKKSRHYVLFTRLCNGQSGPPRMIMIDNAISLESRLVVMQGMVTGCYGANTLFSAPIYIERWIGSTEDLNNQLDITDTVPEVVRSKLSFNVSHNVLRF